MHTACNFEYLVDAENETEARRLVEAASDASAEFGGRALNGEWWVSHVVEVEQAYSSLSLGDTDDDD